MNENEFKEVRFDIYCAKCKHAGTLECQDPCNDCLDWPAREQTEKPLFFEEKESK